MVLLIHFSIFDSERGDLSEKQQFKQQQLKCQQKRQYLYTCICNCPDIYDFGLLFSRTEK